VPEGVAVRGLRVQPTFRSGIVGREDRRAVQVVARAPPGGTRLGLVTVLGWADHGVAPPAPSRHTIAPFRHEPRVDSVGRKSGGADKTPPARRSTRILERRPRNPE